MPNDLWNALERIGKEDGIDRPAGWLVRKACEEYIERHRAAKRAAEGRTGSQLAATDSRATRRRTAG
jgi:hypothetical protein